MKENVLLNIMLADDTAFCHFVRKVIREMLIKTQLGTANRRKELMHYYFESSIKSSAHFFQKQDFNILISNT